MDRIGKYEKIEILGKGGMGEVWKARDTELGRDVALKLLQHGDAEDLVRFKREARIVARLSHPNIAQLYEVGDDPPFIAMQLIAGAPLDKSPIPLGKKVEALEQAARAVHYAHTKSVIHRDLKPANILVDDSGRGIVLDFGLAREVKSDTTALSMSGDIMGTPNFMAPEQARGEIHALDARTDVYGLGATLYALIAGRAPHEGRTAIEVVSKVISEDPARPGGGRDLETICLKALEKDPARRYSTAAELADDLERYRRDEPIRARPASMTYRLQKEIRRRPLVWSLAALLAAAILGGTAFGVIQLWSRARERDRAARRQELLALMERSERRLREIDAELASDVTIERLGELYRSLDEMAAVLAKRTGENPEEAASLWYLCGESHLLRHREESAIDDFTRALDAPESPWAKDMDTRPRAALARAQARLSIFQDAIVSVGEKSRQSKAHEKARPIIESVEADLKLAGSHPRLAVSHLLVRMWMLFVVDPNKIDLSELNRAVSRGGRNEDLHFIRGLIFQEHDPVVGLREIETSVDLHRGRARFWLHLAAVRTGPNAAAEARGDLDRAIRLKPDYAWALVNRGALRLESKDLDGAIQDFTRAIEAAPSLADAYHDRGEARRRKGDTDLAIEDFTRAIDLEPDCGEAFEGRSAARIEKGQYDAAIDDATRAIDLPQGGASAYLHRGDARWKKGELSGAMEDLNRYVDAFPKKAAGFTLRAHVRDSLKDFKGAVADYTLSLEIEPKDAEVLNCRGAVRYYMNDFDEAISDFTRAIELNPRSDSFLINRGRAHLDKGDPAQAATDFEAALAIRPDDADLCNSCGDVRMQIGDPDGAIRNYSRAIVLAPGESTGYSNRAYARLQTKDYAGAAADYDRVIQLGDRGAAAYNNRGYALFLKGELAAGLRDCDRAIELDPELADAYETRGEVRRALGDKRGAIADFEKFLQLAPGHATAADARRWLDELRRP